MTPVTLVAILFWFAAISSIATVALDRSYGQAFRSGWPLLLTIFAVMLAWRIPLDGQFFMGLEYEDSYVYSVAGRAIALGVNPSSEYLTTVCSNGSLLNCREFDQFSGHYVGFPYIISLIDRLLGYSVNAANVASVVAACITLVSLWILGQHFGGQRTAIATCMVFALTPVYASFGTAAFAEPTSNGFSAVMVMLSSRLLYSRADRHAWIRGLIALTAVALMAILVKRENAAVFLVTCAVVAVSGWIDSSKASDGRWRFLWCVASAAVIGLFCLSVIRLNEALTAETSEFGRYPFGIGLVATLAPVFAQSFATWPWYLATLPLAVIGLVRSGLSRRRDALMVLGCAACFLVLYTSHVRSYYMLNYGDVSKMDALRYSMNAMWLWSLLAGIGSAWVFEWVQPTLRIMSPLANRALSVTLAVTLLLVSYDNTTAVRREAVENEQMVRVRPAVDIEAWAKRLDATVITAEPLLMQMYSSPSTQILDLRSIDSETLERIQKTAGSRQLLYLSLDHYHTLENRARYAAAFAEIEKRERIMLSQGEGYAVLALR